MMAAAAAAAAGSSSSGGGGGSSSDTSSTGEEERMRRLFQTCDGDGDGYISRYAGRYEETDRSEISPAARP